MKVERDPSPCPNWPGNAYKRELKENRLARYIVARRTGPPLRGDIPPEAEAPRQRSLTFTERLRQYFGGIQEPLTEHEEILARKVVGYAGLWLMVDEAHVTAIAVAPAYRRPWNWRTPDARDGRYLAGHRGTVPNP